MEEPKRLPSNFAVLYILHHYGILHYKGESADYDMSSSLRRVATIDPPMGCYSSNIDLLRGDEALHEYETIVEKPASMMEEALKSIFLIDNIFVCMLVAVEYMQFERYYTRSRRRV